MDIDVRRYIEKDVEWTRIPRVVFFFLGLFDNAYTLKMTFKMNIKTHH